MASMGSRVAGTEQRKPLVRQLTQKTPLEIDSPVGEIMPACAGDHPAIHQFLSNVFKTPIPATDFNNQLDNPTYEPSNRLLVRYGSIIIAHSRVIDREIQFGDQQIPVSYLTEMGTIPEFRGHGVGTALLGAVEQQMQLNGSTVGVLRTTIPHFYAHLGWSLCTTPVKSVAGAHEILSYLIGQQRQQEAERAVNPLNEPLKQLNIRLWRHVEQDALMRIYQLNTGSCYGAHIRTEAAWRWLFNRRAFDQIYVALESSEKIALGASLHSIIGYAVVKTGRVIELMVDQGRTDVRNQLLQRICSDVIEHQDKHVMIDAQADDVLHNIVLQSGGDRVSLATPGLEVMMVKVFDPLEFTRHLRSSFRKRVRKANLGFPCELGINLETERFQIACNQRSTRLLHGKLGRSYLSCSSGVFSQLLLGQCNISQAIKQEKIIPSTRIASETAQVLFPRIPLWFPSLDDLPA
jgi:predicted acetyltransferase